ncbi:MAG: hypothetical protein IKD12_06900 [Paludibacteraceae bacterium]|nr:hypothetical protein [Paludibacteraceae bacterium]
MTEIIPIEKVKKQGKKDFYYVDEVRCPLTTESQAASRCKQCQHCRIYLGNKVKCTYADDQIRKERKTVTGY